MCKGRGLDIESGKSGADPDFGKFGPIWDWIKFAHIDLSEITLLQGQECIKFLNCVSAYPSNKKCEKVVCTYLCQAAEMSATIDFL